MSDQQRNSSAVRIPDHVKEKLTEIKEEEGYSSYGGAINGVIKERDMLREERDMLRTVLGNFEDGP